MTMPAYPGRSALALALVAVLLGGCTDQVPTAPPIVGTEPPARAALGVMEITISGIGGPEMSAAASPVGPGNVPGTQPDGPNLALVPVGGIGTGEDAESGIQLENLSTGSFTDRGQGVRHVWATYRVRNATAVVGGRGGTPYPVGRRNLTFIAVDDAATVGETPFSALRRFDGSRADDAIAPAIIPTGAVHREPTTGRIISSGPDVLQVLTEAEVAAIDAPAGVSAFPYGFVVSTGSFGRPLGANPAPNQFDGLVTFAFKLPLQTSPGDDPFTISFRALAVEDGETRITQSLEEQSPEGEAAFLRRGGFHSKIVLPGSRVTAHSSRTVCTVRTAGSPGSPTRFIGQPVTRLLSLSPDPHAPGGGLIARDARFEATFQGAVTSANFNTFTVRGLQSGHHFRGKDYAGIGTAAITTPTAQWFYPGEEVEVVLSSRLCIDQPYVARFRVSSAPGSGHFVPGDAFMAGSDPAAPPRAAIALMKINKEGTFDAVLASPGKKEIQVVYKSLWDDSIWYTRSYPVIESPSYLATGDLDGDGNPDLLVSHASGIQVFQQYDYDEFGSGTWITLGQSSPIALGDLDGDGHADIVVAIGSEVHTLMGTGDGRIIDTGRHIAPGSAAGDPGAVLIGDFDNDGMLDVAVVHETGGGAPNLQVFLGNGDGTLTAGESYTAYHLQGRGLGATGDFDGDGRLDLVVVADDGIRILLGAGDGTFTFGATFALDDVPTSIVTGDLNGDGVLDLVAGYGKSFLTLTGAGDGTFGNLRQFATPHDSYAVALGDLNGDDVLDVIVGSSTSVQFVTQQR